jgi:hypothetical protein
MTAQAFTTRCMGRTRKLRSGWSIGSGLTTAPQPAHEHPLAYNRHAPCPTQRTHAIGLWVARNTALSRKDSAKFGISERRGPAPHLRPLQPSAPQSSFGMYLEMMQQAQFAQPSFGVLYLLHVSPMTLRTARTLPPSPWSSLRARGM